MSESLENLREKFLKRKEAFENKRLEVNLNNTKMIVNDSKEILENKIVLLLMSVNLHPNPGPVFPCPVCTGNNTWKGRSV